MEEREDLQRVEANQSYDFEPALHHADFYELFELISQLFQGHEAEQKGDEVKQINLGCCRLRLLPIREQIAPLILVNQLEERLEVRALHLSVQIHIHFLYHHNFLLRIHVLLVASIAFLGDVSVFEVL